MIHILICDDDASFAQEMSKNISFAYLLAKIHDIAVPDRC